MLGERFRLACARGVRAVAARRPRRDGQPQPVDNASPVGAGDAFAAGLLVRWPWAGLR